ncbi:MAG: zeta toxin family protein [Parachlamydiales bacterium]|nr:zeta toxin family protein [Parachlamydiales bacterium]
MFISKFLSKKIIYGVIMAASAIGPLTAKLPYPVQGKDMIMQIFDQEALSLVPDDHFLPKTEIRKKLENYSVEDLKKIFLDFQILKESTFKNAEKNKIFLVTAGAPNSGKSTILENEIRSSDTKYAYVDPDRSCLFNMENTYKQDIFSKSRTPQEAYEHWRDASNFLSNVFLAYGLDKGYAIANGTTMTALASEKVLQSISGKYNYKVKMVHINCRDDLRIESEKLRRESGVFQCSDEDLIEKGKMFFDRLPVYLANCPDITFYLRSTYDISIKAAEKNEGQLTIFDASAFKAIKTLHDEAKEPGYFDRFVY